jgi:hypothetical protein
MRLTVQSYFPDRLKIHFYELCISETAAMSLSISKPSSSRLKSTYRKEDFTLQYGNFFALSEIGLTAEKNVSYW